MCITNRLPFFFSTLLVFGPFVNSKGVPEKKNSSMLVSEYANVAHWGSSRTNRGQIPWTHRSSDASVHYGQNLRSSDKSYDSSEVPAVGEVQERFNLRPYFQYEFSSGSNIPIKVINNKSPEQASTSPTLDYPVYVSTSSSVKSLDVPLLPTVQPVPHEDPYTSLYSSYNPPQKDGGLIDLNNEHDPKPLLRQTTDGFFNSQTDQSDSNDNYFPHMPSIENDNPSFFPSDSWNASGLKYSDSVEENDYRQMLNFVSQQEKPIKDFQYYSHGSHGVAGHNEVILDHFPAGYQSKEPDMASLQMPDHFSDHSYEETLTDHHQVHHEVEKPIEEKRVSKPQYSYYYIGRKLWYIPLYFSVYFIIYVTFLILKSIARHKIQFKHDFADHHGRESRQMTDHGPLNNLHNTVSKALVEGKRKFPVVSM